MPQIPSQTLTVSVVIPVKNDAAELERCLLALGLQTFPADEIIVVDNGSSDESAEVAKRFGVRLAHESSPGIGAASARGYDCALGDVIARLDADCTPGVNWIETIRSSFEARPDLDAITGSAEFSDGPPALRAVARWLYLGSYFWSMTLALGHVPLFGSNMAFRRSVWGEVRDRVHRYDTLMHDDVDLAMHIGPVRRIRFERRLTMQISMRPLLKLDGMPLRLKRGRHSLTAHWPHDFPWLRWTRRTIGRHPLEQPAA